MRQIAQQAALLGTTPVGLPHAMLCWASIFHADVLQEWNRLDEALDLILQAVRLSEQTQPIWRGHSLSIVAEEWIKKGHFQQARAALLEARTL